MQRMEKPSMPFLTDFLSLILSTKLLCLKDCPNFVSQSFFNLKLIQPELFVSILLILVICIIIIVR